MFDIYLGT